MTIAVGGNLLEYTAITTWLRDNPRLGGCDFVAVDQPECADYADLLVLVSTHATKAIDVIALLKRYLRRCKSYQECFVVVCQVQIDLITYLLAEDCATLVHVDDAKEFFCTQLFSEKQGAHMSMRMATEIGRKPSEKMVYIDSQRSSLGLLLWSFRDCRQKKSPDV